MYKNLIVYTAYNGLVLCFGLLLFPLTTHVITTSEFGKVGLFLVIVSFLQPLVGLSSEKYIQLMRHKLSCENYKSFIFTLYGLSLIIFILLTAVIYVYNGADSLIILAPLLCILRYFKNIKLMEFTVDGNANKFGVTNLVTKCAILLSIYIVSMLFTLSAWHYIFSLVIAEIFGNVYAHMNNLQKFVWQVNKFYIVDVIRFGTPIILSTIPMWFVNEYGKVILSQVSMDEVGKYTFYLQLALVYLLFSSSISNAFVSKVFLAVTDGGLKKITLITTLLLVFFGISYLQAVIWISPYIFNESYLIDDTVFMVLISGVTFQALAMVPSHVITYKRKTHFILYSSIISSVIFTCVIYAYRTDQSIMSVSIAFSSAMCGYTISIWCLIFGEYFGKK